MPSTALPTFHPALDLYTRYSQPPHKQNVGLSYSTVLDFAHFPVGVCQLWNLVWGLREGPVGYAQVVYCQEVLVPTSDDSRGRNSEQP